MNLTTHTSDKTIEENDNTNLTTIGGYLLDTLHGLGIDHIFGVPGDYVLKFNKLIEEHEIAFINTTRENTAGYAADAYARVRGIGAACITYGVGINIANAMAQAYVESSPVVYISGAAGGDEYKKNPYLHHLINSSSNERRDTTQLEIFKHVTAAQTLLNDPETAVKEIERVLSCCLNEKKPVYIELPRNRVAAPIERQPFQIAAEKSSDRATLSEAVAETAKLIQQCKKPVIWLGHEIQRFGLSRYILEFAEKFRIPIASSLLGKTAIGEHHPLYLGVYQGKISREEVRAYIEEECDCMLILGVIVSDVNTGLATANLEHKHKLFANLETISIDHHHYHEVNLSNYLKMLASLELNLRFRGDFPANIDRTPDRFNAIKGKKISAEALFKAIDQRLRPEHIVVTDIGDCLFGSIDFSLEKDSFIACSYFSSLGFGIPAAIGVKIAKPRSRVIAITGDGAFQISATELSTALRYGLDPIVIVINNHGYGTERPIIDGTFNDVVNWNYSKITDLIGGGEGVKVSTEDEFETALTHAFQTRNTLHVIEVDIDRYDLSPPMRRFTAAVGDK